MRVVSTSADMTRAIGVAIASMLETDALVVLIGDLGSGKTVMAQGIAGGLGVTERVVSPTFTLAREYMGRVPVHHLDVYRLDRMQEAIDLGLDELFDGAVTLIEWGDGVRELLPTDRLEIELVLLPPDEADDDTRAITISPFGVEWLAREPALAQELDRVVASGSTKPRRNAAESSSSGASRPVPDSGQSSGRADRP